VGDETNYRTQSCCYNRRLPRQSIVLVHVLVRRPAVKQVVVSLVPYLKFSKYTHMAKLGVEFAVVLVVLFGSSQTLQTERCPRASPEELWYSDYSPMLKNTCLEGCVQYVGKFKQLLDVILSTCNFILRIEMSYYFRLIFGRLEDDNLFTFIPHIKEDPE
jgi:hypothetical protein